MTGEVRTHAASCNDKGAATKWLLAWRCFVEAVNCSNAAIVEEMEFALFFRFCRLSTKEMKLYFVHPDQMS